jgi:putative ABC transport system permease protein
VTFAVSTSRRRPGDGGVAARRALIRWAWRLFRGEWRQQALILALLTIAVASAIGFGSAAYNTTGVSAAAGFGTANHL